MVWAQHVFVERCPIFQDLVSFSWSRVILRTCAILEVSCVCLILFICFVSMEIMCGTYGPRIFMINHPEKSNNIFNASEICTSRGSASPKFVLVSPTHPPTPPPTPPSPPSSTNPPTHTSTPQGWWWGWAYRFESTYRIPN